MKNDYKITGIVKSFFSGFGLSFIALIINEILEIKNIWFSILFVCMFWIIIIIITMSIDENNYKK